MANLTQAQIDAFLKAQNQGYTNPETGEYISQAGAGYTGDDGGYVSLWGQSPEALSLRGLDPNETYYTYGNGGRRGFKGGKFGDTYGIYDSQGQDTGQTGLYADKSGLGKQLAISALMMLGGAAAGGAFGGAAAGAGAGGGAAGGGAGTLGVTGANGAFLGEGALSGIGAWDGALAAAGGAGAAGGTAAMGAGSGTYGTMAPMELLPSTMGQYELPGLMSTVGGATGGAAGASAAGAGGGGGGGGSGAGSLLNSAGSALKGAGSWLGPLLGGALGSQPTTSETNTTKKMDPRMDALVYGDGGFLNNATDWYTQNKSGMNDQMRSALAQNRSLLNDPATRQGYQSMATQGQGLLNRQVASNPFTAAQRPQFGSSLLQQYLSGGLLGQ